MLVDCTVEYSGRAKSTLERGSYLIIYKSDGSLAIHGNAKIMPLNYLSSGSKLEINGNNYVWTKRKETISITVHGKAWDQAATLSEHKPKIINTEKDLVDKIVRLWPELIGDTGEIIREHQTIHGPIDLYAESREGHVLIEVKRKNATLKDITQAIRYRETFKEPVRCYVAAPKISKNALAYAEKHRVIFLKVDFD